MTRDIEIQLRQTATIQTLVQKEVELQQKETSSYIEDDRLSPNQIRNVHNDLDGKILLILCRVCGAQDLDVTVSCSGAQRNMEHMKQYE